MKSWYALIACILFSTNIHAETDQLDVIGLVPGVSTQSDVEEAKVGGDYIIGGFRLICVPEFSEGVLTELTCFTGKKNLSQDTTRPGNGFASNALVHQTLVDGFTKKFGSPTDIGNNALTNRFGVKYNQETVSWIDKNGNMLILNSILEVQSIGIKIDEGSLQLVSGRKIEKHNEDIRQSEQLRKF
jgi:hypothetical protein